MKVKYYTVIVDEVADISNKEQLSLALRYVLDGGVKEVFCGSGENHCESLAQAIIQWLATHGLPFTTTREVSAMMVQLSCATEGPIGNVLPLCSTPLKSWCCLYLRNSSI